MRFAIDCDGVISDFDEGFLREANKIWPGRYPLLAYDKTDYDWKNYGMTEEDKQAIWKRVEKFPNFWLSLKPFYENVRAIAIHRMHYPKDEIFYVTARTPTVGMPPMHQTQVWLEQCGIGGLGTAVIVSNSKNKSDIFNALECDANIDDKLEAVIAHDRETNGACLLDRPWNRHERPAGLRVVASLEEFFRSCGGMYETSK